MARATRCGRRSCDKWIRGELNNLRFADVIAAVAEHECHLLTVVNGIERESTKMNKQNQHRQDRGPGDIEKEDGFEHRRAGK